jgi:hypothetical protein
MTMMHQIRHTHDKKKFVSYQKQGASLSILYFAAGFFFQIDQQIHQTLQKEIYSSK